MSDWQAELDPFDFDLPIGRIAQRPAERRSDARLLHWTRDGFVHRRVRELPSLLRAGDLMVINDSKVLPARLFGRKRGGTARVEILLERRLDAERWSALLRPARRLPPGSIVDLDGGAELRVGERLRGASSVVEAPHLDQVADRFGHMPLPPYLQREDDADDRERYQTVFAREPGSVAAPTAGLHFDDELLGSLRAAGVELARVTLHVGLGTFAPLDEAALREGVLHREWMSIPQATQTRVRRAKADGARVVAVGTTACRALESWARADVQDVEADHVADTKLFLRPGDRFEIVDLLLTNFHLPRSSLLMLVAAFAGERWRSAYELAIAEGYRFYSYGDANLIERMPA